jgi:hypothetical protein
METHKVEIKDLERNEVVSTGYIDSEDMPLIVHDLSHYDLNPDHHYKVGLIHGDYVELLCKHVDGHTRRVWFDRH